MQTSQQACVDAYVLEIENTREVSWIHGVQCIALSAMPCHTSYTLFDYNQIPVPCSQLQCD